MPLETLTARALLVLLHLVPPGATYERLPGWEETAEARIVRYRSIASDIAAVAEWQCGTDILCGRSVVHALIGVAYHESSFAPDVDSGHCYRGRDGKSPRCDGGRSHSIWQLRAYGADAALYDSSRPAAAREAWRRIQRSANACRSYDFGARLAVYAGGRCDDPQMIRVSRELIASIQRAAAVRE
jgi:hypothetical protein